MRSGDNERKDRQLDHEQDYDRGADPPPVEPEADRARIKPCRNSGSPTVPPQCRGAPDGGREADETKTANGSSLAVRCCAISRHPRTHTVANSASAASGKIGKCRSFASWWLKINTRNRPASAAFSKRANTTPSLSRISQAAAITPRI